MNYSAITIQGNIISGEIMEKIRTETDDFVYQGPKDFGFEKKSDLRDAIGNAWAEARTLWDLYIAKVEKLPEGDTGTSLTRKFWMVPLLYELGYDLERGEMAIEAERTFNISHRAQNLDQYPVLIMGYHQKLDVKPDSRILRISPHALVQEYLNFTEHLYGLVTNGRVLRLLRDSNRLTKLAYLEFDLERMMEEDLYHEFALMYRILHASRMPKSQDEVEKAIIEHYHQESIDSGARIRDKLREAVEEAMTILAGGLLAHPANAAFKEAVMQDKTDAVEFYRILLRVMYRIIFLATIEERDLVYPDVAEDQKKEQFRLKKIYEQFYSLNRLRNLAMAPIYIDPRKDDLWQGLMATFRLFEPMGEGEKLGLFPLGGDLFGKDALCNKAMYFYTLRLDNRNFIEMISRLTLFKDSRGVTSRVNYRDLNVEELGSIYESLLELHPYFDIRGAKPAFAFSYGSERKTTGSYYTRHDLVAQLIKSALIPVMEERVATTGWKIDKKGNEKEAEAAILDIKVCDPAAGSGHFLLAASRVLAFQLARVRTGEENPGDDPFMAALRDVIEHCIYGVDLNPAAVELCRLSLWLIGHNKGKPLTFLEHKIKCGNSLVGLDTLDRLPDGIPDGAFKPLTGDDKAIASHFKKLNASYVKGRQFSIFQESGNESIRQSQLATQYKSLSDRPVDSMDDFDWKRKQYQNLRNNPSFRQAWNAANLFTYAFFQSYNSEKEDKDIVTTETIGNFIASKKWDNEDLIRKVEAVSEEHHFFHWSLEFPDVFDKGGFDVMLGNPPWEAIQPEEIEFFKNTDPNISRLPGNKRKKAIINLFKTNLKLYTEWINYSKSINSQSKYYKESEKFHFTVSGKLNTYSLFTELNALFLNSMGRLSLVVPIGIATDNSNKDFFWDVLKNKRLEFLYGFENESFIFPSVHHSFKFCLVTISGNRIINQKATFIFFCRNTEDIKSKIRRFEIGENEIALLNPNTKTCPIFRTNDDFNIALKVYKCLPVLFNSTIQMNPWRISLKQGLYNMTSDSDLFLDTTSEFSVPLYEAKLIYHFDHRYSTYENASQAQLNMGTLPGLQLEEKQDPGKKILTRYFIENIVFDHTINEIKENYSWKKNWFLCFRDITSSISERTSIFSILPKVALGNNIPILFSQQNTNDIGLLLANFNSIVFDFVARQKVAGNHLNFFILEQLPIVTIDFYSVVINLRILPKVIELVYPSWDIKAFADDLWKESDKDLRKAILEQWEENKAETGGHEWRIPEWHEAYPEIHWHSPMEKSGWTEEELLDYNEGCPLPPFKWDENRRALLKAELDAYFALLYGLERDELRYILDPQDVYGEDFPGETFRVLKEKEIKKYGEYRTRRLVLEAYDRLRPGWDMEEHMRRLKEVWEDYQNSKFQIPNSKQNSRTKTQNSKSIEHRAKGVGQEEPENSDLKAEDPNFQFQVSNFKSQVAEKDEVYKQGRLFDEPNLFSQGEGKVVGPEAFVTIRRLRDGHEYHYHVTPDAQPDHHTGKYKQISTASGLFLAMRGKKAGERFEYGDVKWEVVGVENRII